MKLQRFLLSLTTISFLYTYATTAGENKQALLLEKKGKNQPSQQSIRYEDDFNEKLEQEKNKALEMLCNDYESLAFYYQRLQENNYQLPYKITVYDGGIIKVLANSHLFGESKFSFTYNKYPTFSLHLAGKKITIKQYPAMIYESILGEKRTYSRRDNALYYKDQMLRGKDPLIVIHELLKRGEEVNEIEVIFYGSTKTIPLTWKYEKNLVIISADLSSLVTNKNIMNFSSAKVYAYQLNNYLIPLVFEIKGRNLKIPFFTIDKFSALGILHTYQQQDN